MRFAKAFFSVLLYLIIWGAILLLPALFVEPEIIAIAAAICFPFIVGLLFPYMNWVAKRVFRYPGTGAPVSLEKLKNAILEINQWDVPVRVQEKKDRLLVSWNYVDAKWWEILAKSGMKQVYELHLKFNDKRKYVTLIDVKKSVKWRAGPGQVKISGGYFRGVDLTYERAIAYAITEAYQFGKVYDYRFKTSEIKDPVLNTINQLGWEARMGLY